MISNYNPLVSIIIPVYNVKQYLMQCIESIANLNNEQIEIILIDDGSTDGSAKICDELSDNDARVKVVHQANAGLSMARNVGILEAKGKYITFIDSDDVYENGTIEAIVDKLRNNDYDLLFIEMKKFYNGNIADSVSLSYINPAMVEGKSKDCVIKYISSLGQLPVSACTKIVRNDIIKSQELFFKKDYFSEDVDWFFNVMMSPLFKNFGVVDKSYYYRQNRVGSITNNASAKNVNDLYNIIVDVISKTTNKYILSMAAYEIMILVLICNKGNNEEWYIKISKIVPIMKYNSNKKVQLVSLFCKMCGVKFTNFLLNKVKK